MRRKAGKEVNNELPIALPLVFDLDGFQIEHDIYSPRISIKLFNFELLPDPRQEYISSSIYLLLTNLP